MADPSEQIEPRETVRRLRAMAAGWDRCAANAQDGTVRRASHEDTYRRWARECRDKADRIEDESSWEASRG